MEVHFNPENCVESQLSELRGVLEIYNSSGQNPIQIAYAGTTSVTTAQAAYFQFPQSVVLTCSRFLHEDTDQCNSTFCDHKVCIGKAIPEQTINNQL